jgi:hypothetical protein
MIKMHFCVCVHWPHKISVCSFLFANTLHGNIRIPTSVTLKINQKYLWSHYDISHGLPIKYLWYHYDTNESGLCSSEVMKIIDIHVYNVYFRNSKDLPERQSQKQPPTETSGISSKVQANQNTETQSGLHSSACSHGNQTGSPSNKMESSLCTNQNNILSEKT